MTTQHPLFDGIKQRRVCPPRQQPNNEPNSCVELFGGRRGGGSMKHVVGGCSCGVRSRGAGEVSRQFDLLGYLLKKNAKFSGSFGVWGRFLPFLPWAGCTRAVLRLLSFHAF